MLEQQQAQLVAGLQETYQRLQSAQLWPGAPLQEHEGHVLTHDILTRLDILNKDGEVEVFEEDVDKLQLRLLSQGASYMHRRGSVSSDSDHSHTQSHSRQKSYDSPIASPVKPNFRGSFAFDITPAASPATQSPVSHGASLRTTGMKPSPLHNESPIQADLSCADDDLYMSTWPGMGVNGFAPDMLRSEYALQQPALQDSGMNPRFDNWQQQYDTSAMNFDAGMMAPFQLQQPPMPTNMTDWSEPMEVDFSKFIQVAT